MNSGAAPIRILYCHCAFARVVPPEVKSAVLTQLAASSADFEAVPDLCEMSARRDPRLSALADNQSLRIAACYSRAVRGLFEAAGSPLPQSAQILNMRTEAAVDITAKLLEETAP
jgi:hypothetical protein